VFCALHHQLASLTRHAQLTRCVSAVAELLVDWQLEANLESERENWLLIFPLISFPSMELARRHCPFVTPMPFNVALWMDGLMVITRLHYA